MRQVRVLRVSKAKWPDEDGVSPLSRGIRLTFTNFATLAYSPGDHPAEAGWGMKAGSGG
jgi:hypothetical protein